MKYKVSVFLGLMVGILILGCAKQRPIKEVPQEVQRLEKAFFTQDDYYYKVTVTKASPDAPVTFRGDQSFGTALVRWEMTQNTLSANMVDPRYPIAEALRDPVISFPIEDHVDIELEKNADEEETHIQVETKKERAWDQRKFAKVNFAEGKILHRRALIFLKSYESLDCISEVASDLIGLEKDEDSLNIDLRKQYEIKKQNKKCSFSENSPETFSIDLRLSFLKKKPNPTFEKRLYSEAMQHKVGFFKTTVKELDRWNTNQEKDYAIHWDKTKPIVFYFSENTPNAYKPLIRSVIDNWNKTFSKEEVAGKPILELRENTGQNYGDLRYNFIVWIDEPIESGLLGFGPSVWDPYSGEIINATSFVFAGNFKHAVLRYLQDQEMKKEIEKKKAENATHSVSQNSTSLENSENFKEIEKKVMDSPYTIQNLMTKLQDETTIEGQLHALKTQGYCMFDATEMLEASADTASKEKSAEELFRMMIADTLVHEMGHNFGLRHNFMGSYDKAHYISETIHVSSVMDYLALEESEGGQPGPYDTAALSFAFTGNFDHTQNYKYCSDEQAISDPFCNRWDKGSTGSEIVEYLTRHYYDNFFSRSFRGRKKEFKDSNNNAWNHFARIVLNYFLPMREFFDYSQFVLKTGRTLYGDLLEREAKVALFTELFEASLKGYDFFDGFLRSRQFPYENALYPYKIYEDELAIRGVQIDKIAAILMLTSRNLFGLNPWYKLDANYYDAPVFQGSMILLLNTLIRQEDETLIGLLGMLHTLVETSKPQSISLGGNAIPHTELKKLFEIHRSQKTDELLTWLNSQGSSVEYVIDENEIWWAKTDDMITIYPATPTSYIQRYKHLLDTLKTAKAEDEHFQAFDLARKTYIQIFELLSEVRSANDDLSNLSRTTGLKVLKYLPTHLAIQSIEKLFTYHLPQPLQSRKAWLIEILENELKAQKEKYLSEFNQANHFSDLEMMIQSLKTKMTIIHRFYALTQNMLREEK